MPHECPNGHGPLTRGRKVWLCEECDFRRPLAELDQDIEPPQSAWLTMLPSPLAVPLGELEQERHPVLKLHRLCDVVENLIRFAVIVELAEVRAQCGSGPLPEALLADLQPRIERPTLGQWRDMLTSLCTHLKRSDPLVLPELYDFCRQEFLPLLALTIPGLDANNLIDLRNRLAHGGPVTAAWAQMQLDVCHPFLKQHLDRLSFLHNAAVCYLRDGAAWHLQGREEQTAPLAQLTTELRIALQALDGRVVLLHGGRWLDLWPLCDWGKASSQSVSGPRQTARECSLVYFRAEQNRLLYAALGSELPHGERRDVVAEFRALFQLDARATQAAPAAADFEDELRADSASLIGREPEFQQAKQCVKDAQRGVLWISGPGGIGKSFLMARLADDLRGDSRKVCRIAWRFKTSDQARGNRTAFFRHAVEKLASWLGQDITPAADVQQLGKQLEDLLVRVSALTPDSDHPQARAPRVLFVLDGIDEIAQVDTEFASVPFRMLHDNVVWLCAGRPEGQLPSIFSGDRCTHVFPGGLPAMSADDIRAMLLERTGTLKYNLLPLDDEQTGTIKNPAVEAIVARAAGLPLYVHLVIEDLLAGELRYEDLSRPGTLPASLSAYYDRLLQRLALGELQALLTPLVVTIAWARAPLEEETLHWLMVHRKVTTDDEAGRHLLRRGLAAVQSMVRSVGLPGGGVGYLPYHLTFGEHIHEDRGRIIGVQNPLTRQAFCELGTSWGDMPADHPARSYALRFGVSHLIAERRWDDLESLLTDLRYVEARCLVGQVFDLARDYTHTLDALPVLQPHKEAERRHAQQVQQYVQDLIAHAAARGKGVPFPAPPASNTSLRPLRQAGPGEQPADGSSQWKQAERIQRFANFVWGHSHLLVTYPEEMFVIARNHAAAGPVVEQSERLLAQTHRNWVARDPRPPMRPLNPALVRTLTGHTDKITAVALSADGRVAVSESYDKTLRVWDVESGERLHTLQGNSGQHRNIMALSADGRVAVSVNTGNILCVWDVENGECLYTLEGHTLNITSVALSADGRVAVSGSDDSTLRVWDVERGECLHTLEGHTYLVTGVALSADGRRAISGGRDLTLRVWDIECGRPLFTMDGKAIPPLALSADGRLAISNSNRSLQIWNVESGQRLHSIPIDFEPLTLALSADGCRAASICQDHTLRVWDVPTGECLHTFNGPTYSLGAMALSADGRRAISGSLDPTLCVWNLDCDEPPQPLTGHSYPVFAIAASADGRRAISGGNESKVRAWDVDRGECLHTLQGHTSVIKAVAITADGNRAISGSRDSTLRVWNLESGKCLHVLEGHSKAVLAVAILADGQRVISGSSDHSLRVWDIDRGECLHILKGHKGSVDAVTVSPVGRRAISVDFDLSLRIWDIENGECLHVLEWRPWTVDVLRSSADGRLAVLGCRDGTLRVWDVDSGQCLHVLEPHRDIGDAMAISTDGRIAISASKDKTLRVWDVEHGRCLRCLQGHTKEIKSIALSADGRVAISVSIDKTLRIWDVEHGTLLAVYPFDAHCTAMTLVSNTKFVAGDADGQLHFLTLRGE